MVQCGYVIETKRKLELFIIHVAILFRESSSGIASGRGGWARGMGEGGFGAVMFNSYNKLNAQLLEINSHAVCCDLMVRTPERTPTSWYSKQTTLEC